MSRIHTAAAAYLLGAVAGALLSAGFAIGPIAHADVLPTLPVPPFDPPSGTTSRYPAIRACNRTKDLHTY